MPDTPPVSPPVSETDVVDARAREEAAIRARLPERGDFLIHQRSSGEMQLWHRSNHNAVLCTPIQRDANGLFIDRWEAKQRRFTDQSALRWFLTEEITLYDTRNSETLRTWAEAAPHPAELATRLRLIHDIRARHNATSEGSLQVVGVSNLPPVMPRRMTHLWVANCFRLSELPTTLPLHMQKLTLSGCTELTRLSNLPAQLERLEVIDAHALRLVENLPLRLKSLQLNGAVQLEALQSMLPASLTSLDLSNCGALATLPTLPEHLSRLILKDCLNLREITTLPSTVQELNLRGCRSLTSLPAQRPPHLQILDITGCIALPSELPAWVREIPFFRHDNTPESRQNPVEYWLRQAGNSQEQSARILRDWQRIRGEEGGAHFETLLKRIAAVGTVRAQLTPAQVSAVIKEACLSEHGRRLIFAAAWDADRNCHDRPLLLFNDIQILAKGSLLLRGNGGEEALLALARGGFKQALLDDTVNAVMHKQWSEPFDPSLPLSEDNRRRQSNPAGDGPNIEEGLEVQLALRERLGPLLDLPITVQGLYTDIGALNLSDELFARGLVELKFNDPAQLLDGVLAQPVWQLYLEKQHAAALQAISERYQRKGDALDEAQQRLPESERLSDQAYAQRFEQLSRQRQAALDTVLRQKTEEALHYPEWGRALRTFSTDYLAHLNRLRQRVSGYITAHPGSGRVPAMQNFAEQLDGMAQKINHALTSPLAEQVRLGRQMMFSNDDLPSVHRLKLQATVPRKRIGASYQAILRDLTRLNHQRLTPPAKSSSKLRVSGSLPGHEALLDWRSVRDHIAAPFSETGRSLGAQVRQAPQAVWLATDTAQIRRGRCTGLALAWALDPSSETLFDNIFAAAAHPDDPQARDFRAGIDDLHAQDGSKTSVQPEIHNWNQALSYLAAQKGARALLIHVGNHSVALAAHGQGEQTRYAFFDPNAGAWQNVTGAEPMQRALAAHFTPALRDHYGFNGRIEALRVQPPAPDSPLHRAWQRARAALMPTIAQLRRQDHTHGLLELNGQRWSRAELYREGATVNGAAVRADTRWTGQPDLRLPPRARPARQPNKAVGTVGTGLRLYGAYRSLSSTFENFKNQQWREAAIDLGSLAGEVAGEGVERGAARLAAFLPRALKHASSSVAVAGGMAGRLLSHGAGILGALVTLPFDLYSAITRFRQAETTQGQERQDALFQGSMATIGMAIGVGVALAAAASASAATVAGPLGLAAGVLLIVTTQIYSAVRQVQDVEEWIKLSAAERLKLGWRYFSWQGIERKTEKKSRRPSSSYGWFNKRRKKPRACWIRRRCRLARCSTSTPKSPRVCCAMHRTAITPTSMWCRRIIPKPKATCWWISFSPSICPACVRARFTKCSSIPQMTSSISPTVIRCHAITP